MSNLNVPYILSTADYVILVILDHSCSFIGFNSFDPYIICQFCTDKLKQAVIDRVLKTTILDSGSPSCRLSCLYTFTDLTFGLFQCATLQKPDREKRAWK